MASTDYTDLLRKNDLSDLNRPPEFDRGLALERVENLRTSLEECLGFRPVLDDQIQDATHFAELQIKPQINREKCAVIRFSKFGKLVTILFPEEMGAEKFSLVVNEMQRHGYIFIPSEMLDQPYDGRLEGIATWMVRFFYYY